MLRILWLLVQLWNMFCDYMACLFSSGIKEEIGWFREVARELEKVGMKNSVKVC